MGCPSFLKIGMKRRLKYKTIGPSGAEIGNVKWYAHFKGDNYISFDSIEVMPANEAGFISWSGIVETADLWLITTLEATASPESGRITIYNKKLYVSDAVVGSFSDSAWNTLSDKLPHEFKVGRNAAGEWYFNVDGNGILTSSEIYTAALRINSFGTEYSGTTSAPSMTGYPFDINLNNVIQLPLRGGYTPDLLVTDAVGGSNVKYVNFLETDFVKQVPDFYGDASINNAQLTVNDQPVRIMLGA